MNPLRPVHCEELSPAPMLDVDAWRADCLLRRGAGQRLLTAYGRKATQGVLMTSIFVDPAGAISASRATIDPLKGYESLTPEWPAWHCFERELVEQTAIRVVGHPWLKPIRSPLAAMAEYPYYSIAGKEVHEVAVGPIHAGVIEPGSFRFQCLGEQVHHLEIQLGYQHRGVEGLLLNRPVSQLTPLVETIAGDTSVGNAWAYCAAIETLLSVDVALEDELMRAILLELERVAMHLATLSGLAADIGLLQGSAGFGRLRTSVINSTMRLCGSRFGRGAIRPGGLGVRPRLDAIDGVAAQLLAVAADLTMLGDYFVSSESALHRFVGVGTLSPARAEELGVVGVAARASGIPVDARSALSEGAYRDYPLEAVLASDGDCFARAKVRIDEMVVSLRWLERALACDALRACTKDGRAAGATLEIEWERLLLPPCRLAVSIREGVRGELLHCLETGPAGDLVRYKVQDPSFRNWMGLAIAQRGNEISDFPVCNKSFDLSYCGNDL